MRNNRIVVVDEATASNLNKALLMEIRPCRSHESQENVESEEQETALVEDEGAEPKEGIAG